MPATTETIAPASWTSSLMLKSTESPRSEALVVGADHQHQRRVA